MTDERYLTSRRRASLPLPGALDIIPLAFTTEGGKVDEMAGADWESEADYSNMDGLGESTSSLVRSEDRFFFLRDHASRRGSTGGMRRRWSVLSDDMLNISCSLLDDAVGDDDACSTAGGSVVSGHFSFAFPATELPVVPGPEERLAPGSLRYLPKILRRSYSIGGGASSKFVLPEFLDVRGSVLILDLSGFTALGERLSAELGVSEGAAQLAQRVDTVLSTMVKSVYEFGGDVLKFAGDALICLFEEEHLSGGSGDVDLEAARLRSLRRIKDCCLWVLGEVAMRSGNDFTIHGGAAHGLVRCFFLGQPSITPGDCAFVVSGRPLQLTGQLLDRAGTGEVLIGGMGSDGGPLTITEEQGRVVFKAAQASKGLVSAKDHPAIMDEDQRVHLYARAYLGTLAASRCERAENAMSILLNELRPVAVLFVSLHDLDNIDPTDANLLRLMNDTFVTLTRLTHNCNGTVMNMLFDDKGYVFISVFGAHSHEANPCFDATICAMEMENSLKELGLERFSLGVSFGDCFCGEVGPRIRADYTIMGTEVNMAARLMGKAPNRGTLVSQRVYRHSRKHIRFDQTEAIDVKGKDGSFHAYIPQMRSPRMSSKTNLFDNVDATALKQPFIPMPSREEGMCTMLKALDDSTKYKPRLILVSGGPFLGKTRMINKLSEKASNADFIVLQSFRTSLDSFTSYFPFRQITEMALRQCVSKLFGAKGFEDENSALMLLMKHRVLDQMDRATLGSIVPTVTDAHLLSLLKGKSPKAMAKAIVDSLIKILEPLQPLMLVFEGDGDIDPSSWGIFHELMRRAPKECPRILLVMASRNVLSMPNSMSNVLKDAVQVQIAPLDKYETEVYLKLLLGIQDKIINIDEKMLDAVHDRANGCPLFIDYIVTWALEKNMIEYLDEPNKMTFKHPYDDHSEDASNVLPRELSNIVLAAFNNLSPILWDALKIASCIGYSFDTDVYESLTASLDFIPKVEELAESYDAFERPDGSNRIKWKHQAVYEAVKSLLIKNQSIQIHSMIVDVFERNDGTDSPLKPDAHRLLARHCSLAERWDGAFNQYMEAGKRAEDMYNFNEAARMYEEAIICQGKMGLEPSLRSKLLPTVRLGSCLRELARYDESEAVLLRCLNEAENRMSENAGDKQMYVHALTALAILHQNQSRYNEARELYEKALPIARKIDESTSSLWLAGHIAGYAEILRKSGDLPFAEILHREALDLRNCADKDNSYSELELAVSYTQLGCTLFGLGQFHKAYDQHRQALLSRFKYLDSHGLVSESLNYCAETLCALGRGGDGIPLAMHAVEIRKIVFGPSHPALAHALSVLASCYNAVGRACDAKELLERCLGICEEAFPKNHANIIPNLMNYGEVLRSLEDHEKAREVYERAIAIHQLNFSENQKADQLEKCRSEVLELTQAIHSTKDQSMATSNGFGRKGDDVNVPTAETETGANPVILITDVGRDVDDEYCLVMLAALSRMHMVNPLAVITTLSPSRERAYLARGILDSLGLSNVPVGIGSAGGVESGIELEVYEATYARSCSCVFESGVELMVRALESAPSKSVQLLCVASLTDAATLIRNHECLVTSKVKDVVVMGGLKPLDSASFLEPDTAYNNNCDMDAAQYVYQRCQELGVPTVTLARWAAYGCPVSTMIFDDLCKTAHMVAANTRKVSMAAINHLWSKVNFPLSDPRREKLPPRCDRHWFCTTFLGEDDITRDGSASIWDLVTKLNMYDPLALLCSVPVFRDAYFCPETKVVNNTAHKVIGISPANKGIRDADALREKLFSLFMFALQSALQEMC